MQWVSQDASHIFRRKSADRADYVSVQFYSAGGSFVVELASAGGDGKRSRYGRHLAFNDLNAQYFTERHRLGSHESMVITGTFSVPEATTHKNRTASRTYENVARQAAEDLAKQAERWFAARRVA